MIVADHREHLDLLEAYRRDGDRAARDRLIEELMPLVRSLASATRVVASRSRISFRSVRSGSSRRSTASSSIGESMAAVRLSKRAWLSSRLRSSAIA